MAKKPKNKTHVILEPEQTKDICAGEKEAETCSG
jgi:hypothetical protein